MKLLETLETRTLFASHAASTADQLIGAINAANNSAGADTITLAAGATFALTAVDNTTNGSTGLPRITDSAGLTIVGNGSVVRRGNGTDAAPSFRLLDVAAGGALTLQNLTLQGGVTSPVHSVAPGRYALDPANGGAILSAGTLTLDGVTVRGNVAAGSSGSWSFFVIPVGNGAGGGVHSTGTLTLTGCTFEDNHAIGGAGANSLPAADPGNFPPTRPATPSGHGYGGGLYIGGGSASISNSTFTANSARGGRLANGVGAAPGSAYGGGIYLANAAATLRQCTVTLNSALGAAGSPTRNGKSNDGHGIGGGIFRGSGGSLALDVLTIANVSDNTASSGSSDIAGSYKRLRD